MSMLLSEMKTTDFQEGQKYTFVIPTGSTEQHGPFLPMGTDTSIQDRIVQELNKELPEVIFLPTLPITCSQEHDGFPGTVWIQYDTMRAMIQDMCTSLAPYAKQIILMTAHGGNVALLREEAHKLNSRFDDVQIDYVDDDSEELEKKTQDLLGGPVDAHAGNSEISIMLIVEKSLVNIPVNEEKVTIDEPWKTNRLKDFSMNGVADNHPEWMVSAEIGQKILGWIMEDVTKRLREMLI